MFGKGFGILANEVNCGGGAAPPPARGGSGPPGGAKDIVDIVHEKWT